MESDEFHENDLHILTTGNYLDKQLKLKSSR